MNQKLLDFKNRKKAKNPRFIRQDAYKKKRLLQGWRKPRGWDSKQRKRMQRQAIVEPGYGSPVELRGVHKSGLEIVLVNSFEQLKQINLKSQGIIVSGRLGLKKKMLLITEATKQNIRILNIPKPGEYLKKKEEMKQKAKKLKEQKTEKQKETKEKKSKESIDDKLSDDEKKKLEKKEIDRLLTKKF